MNLDGESFEDNPTELSSDVGNQPAGPATERITVNWRSPVFLTAVALLVVLLVAAGTYVVLTSPPWLAKHNDVLITNQVSFRGNDINRQALEWLAERWHVDEKEIYMIVQDSEPWMQIVGLLHIPSLSSATIWILDTNHKEGQAWETALAGQALPHEGKIYLVHEYKPATGADQDIAARFYSTQTLWYGNPLGGLAIIEDIRWTNVADGSGDIIAYQSQKYLPSINIPIKRGLLLKFLASQTPVH